MGRRRPFGLSCPGVIGRGVLAMAGGLLLAPGPAAAAPDPATTPTDKIADVRAQVEVLHRQAEQASERHNAADERAGAAQARLREMQARLEGRRGQLETLRGVIGKVAASTYRSGAVDPAMLLVFSERPEDFLRQASALATVSARQRTALCRLTRIQRRQNLDRAEAGRQATLLAESRDELSRERTVIEQRLAEAEDLLGNLAAQELAELNAADRAAA